MKKIKSLSFSDKIHIIGIGGSGMSKIAHFLLQCGYQVSGCDIQKNQNTIFLDSIHVPIFTSHSVSHIQNADVVVYSESVTENILERRTAKQKNVTLLSRSDIIGLITASYEQVIAVSGSHGKTTTSSILSHIVRETKSDFSFIVGGQTKNQYNSAYANSSPYLLIELDESNPICFKTSIHIPVLLNIDNDHLENYGTFQNIKKACTQFLNQDGKSGLKIVNGDDTHIQSILPQVLPTVVSFGLSKHNDCRATDIKSSPMGSSFNLIYKKKNLGQITTQLIGIHNIFNIVSACTVALQFKISLQQLQACLLSYRPPQRRFQKITLIKDVLWFDDFGHHPTEIHATITSIKNIYSKKIVVLFQPHRYSRTKLLLKELSQSLLGVDEIFVLPIYSALEKYVEDISSEMLVAQLSKLGHTSNKLVKTEQELKEIKTHITPNSLFLSLGAGDVFQKAKQIFI